jgi:D-alanyl-D-alanine carboxypeptidase (penicillin-binding protein 5/6)
MPIRCNPRRSIPSCYGRALATMAAILLAGASAMPALASGPRPVSQQPARPQVPVPAAALAVPGSGAVLWAREPGRRRPMGSITKVMTALLVLRAGHLNRVITVTRAAVAYGHRDGASNAGLVAGDKLTARQLLRAMLLPSGCDAAYLLATTYGPGRPAFIAKMNTMARRLEMRSTHFSWFDGMPYPTEHSTYSTPADLLTLGQAAMASRQFRRIVAERSYYLPATRRHHAYHWTNTNALLRTYRGAIGIKTGDTSAAGDCIMFEARRSRHALIGVVLHARTFSAAFAAATVILNWGYRHT